MIIKLKITRFWRYFLDFYLKSWRTEEIAPGSSANPPVSLENHNEASSISLRVQKPFEFHLPRVARLSHLENTTLTSYLNSRLNTRRLTCLARVTSQSNSNRNFTKCPTSQSTLCRVWLVSHDSSLLHMCNQRSYELVRLLRLQTTLSLQGHTRPYANQRSSRNLHWVPNRRAHRRH